MFSFVFNQEVYDVLSKWFATLTIAVSPILFFWDAPFGRFTRSSIFLVDGIKSWIIMELPSPLTFLYTFLNSPLSPPPTPPPIHRIPFKIPLKHPNTLLALLYLTHYLNRSLLSPLRTPSRSRTNIIVPICAIIFNVINGSLMGAYLSSPAALRVNEGAYERWGFWVGVGIWMVGFVGNVVHDEILLNIRRDKLSKSKSSPSSSTSSNGELSPSSNKPKEELGEKGEHYSIPTGLLYTYISYPNYLCEWLEWLGFALASSPHSFSNPPWIFVSAEFFTMVGRAWRGHLWYKRRFGEYPRERRAVVPFIL